MGLAVSVALAPFAASNLTINRLALGNMYRMKHVIISKIISGFFFTKNSVASVLETTIPTDQPPLACHVSANFCE
jgi:hypothetical protein